MPEVNAQFKQLTDLAAISQSFRTLNLDNFVDAIAQQVQSGAVKDITEAVTELKDAGLDPMDFIAQPRSAQRAKQQQLRMEAESAKAQQALDHQAALNALEIRKMVAEVRIAEASADRMSASQRPVPAPPQSATV